MIKPKHSQPSQFWTNLADRLRFSRSFSFYALINPDQATAALEKFQARPRNFRSYTLELESATVFRLMMFYGVKEKIFLEAWIVGQIQPVENMERVKLQGKVYSNLREPLIGIVLSLMLSPVLFNWHTDKVTLVNLIALIVPILVFAWAWRAVLQARNRLLTELERHFSA